MRYNERRDRRLNFFSQAGWKRKMKQNIFHITQIRVHTIQIKQKGQIRQQGFTLIELLIVMAIIGILTSIAVPSFLGQREKAKVRAVEAGAKGTVADIQGWLDAFTMGDPILAVNTAGSEVCIQATTAAPIKSCDTIYNQASNTTYDPNNISSLIALILEHHAGKAERSPYNASQSLFVSATGTSGTIVVTPSGTRSIRVQGFAENTAASATVFNTTVSSR